MSHRMTRIGGWLVTLTILIAVAAFADEDVLEERDVERDATILIGVPAGDVVVVGWDRPRVKIEGELGEGTRRLDITGDKDKLVIEVVVPRRKRYVEGSDLEIHVPIGAKISIQTMSADIDVENLENELTVSTASGDIDIESDLRELMLDTLSGDVDLRGKFGECVLETTSGDLEIVSQAVERFAIDAVSGDLVLMIDEVANLTAETVSGEIEFEGDITGRANIRSQSGSIELTFPSEPDAEFEVTTFNGEIENSFGPEPWRVDRWDPEIELSFASGDGDADIRIETFSGDVVLDTK